MWPTWESWTWPGHEGKDIQVEVYAKYPSVRLYLNDTLIGEQPTGVDQQFKAVFTLPYAPGSLRAVGMNGNAIGEAAVLRTAGSAAGIRLTADRTDIAATGLDLSFVTVEIIDEAGTVQPTAKHRLQLSIDGPGVIAGSDNADLTDLDSCTGDTRKVWNGRALVVIRSTRSAGDIVLTVRSEGLPAATITVKAGNDRA